MEELYRKGKKICLTFRKTGNIIKSNEQQVSVNPVYKLLVFVLLKMNIAMKKCVACQRKSSLYDSVTLFLCRKREELKQNGGKQQDEGDAGE